MSSIINQIPARSESVWYIIKPSAHEGPYSYDQLLKKLDEKSITGQSLIWARGWPEAVAFSRIQEVFDRGLREINLVESQPVIDFVDLNEEPFDEEEKLTAQQIDSNRAGGPRLIFAVVIFALGLGSAFSVYLMKQEPNLDRPQSVSLAEFREVKLLFENTASRIPLPKFLNTLDFKKLSLVDRSNQNCSYSVSFISDASQNLSQEKIAFSSQAQSHLHWVVFDRFEFREGQRLIPGHYEINILRTNCQPVGWSALIESSDEDYSMSFKQSFYTSSVEDLEKSLKLLDKKKQKEKLRSRLASIDAWKEINEKFRTLSAISKQISTDFKLLLDRKFKWQERVDKTIQTYTLRYGSFLNEFIKSNDEDFRRISELEIPMKVELLGRSPLIVGFAQRIGFISSQVIEKIDRKGVVPNRTDLELWLKEFETSLNLEVTKIDMAMREVDQIIQTESASLEEAQSL